MIQNELLKIQKSLRKIYTNQSTINDKIIKLHESTFGSEEVYKILETLVSGNVTMGKKVLRFEDDLKKYFSISNAVSNNSGSSANLLAISGLCNHLTKNRLNPGDEVIVPSLSWSTTIWPLIQNNLVPVFVDIDLQTLNIDPVEIEKAITKKTKAIMIVPVYGNACEMDQILKICRKYKLQLIEDTCESLGAKYKDRYLGTFGRVSTYSFYFSHHITTLEGGVTLTNDNNLAEVMRMLRAHGWLREVKKPNKYLSKKNIVDKRFLFPNIGYNLRLTEIQGAMGSVQLKKLNRFVNSRRVNANLLKNGLSKYDNFFHFQKETKNSKHSYFGFPIILKNNKFKVDNIRAYLEKHNIETRPIICGNMTKQPALKHYKYKKIGSLKNSTKVMHDGFAIACHQSLNKNSINYILKTFDDYFKDTF